MSSLGKVTRSKPASRLEGGVMAKASKLMTCVAICLTAVLLGCGRPYVVTRDLTRSFDVQATCRIGELADALPPDHPASERPTAEDLGKLKAFLRDELQKRPIFARVGLDLPGANYEVSGEVCGYTRGSGLVRFLIGMGAGKANMNVALRVVDLQTNEIVFAGNFSREVASGLESGADVYLRIASDFANALQQQASVPD